MRGPHTMTTGTSTMTRTETERWRDTLPGLLAGQVAQRPNGVALRRKDLGIWQEKTWAEYYAGVRAVAVALDELGIRSGDRVGLVADNEPAWLFVDLGAQSLGALSVAAYPTQVAKEIAYVMSHSRARVAFCGDQEQVDKVLEVRGELAELQRIVVFDMKGVAEYGDPMIESYADFVGRGRKLDEADPARFERHLHDRDPDDHAFVGYTSGTTGRPKGALLRHRNQVAMARVMAEWAKFTEKDRDFCHFPLPHPAVRVMDAYSALVSGCSVNFPESVVTVREDMIDIAPTFLLGTPRVFELFKADIELRVQRAAWIKRRVYAWGTKTLAGVLERRLAHKSRPWDPVLRFLAHWLVGRWVLDRSGLLKLRYATLGGASVSPELLKFFWALGLPVFETYGQSETSGIAFSQKHYDDLGTAGWVLPGYEAKIGEHDELLLSGEGIFAGYLDDPEKTAAAFRDGWYRTGDIARFDDAGRVIILDREKHVLHTAAGVELSPSEIENKLKLSPYIADAMVIGEGRDYVTALVQIEYETVADWAQSRNLAYTTFYSLTQLTPVQELIWKEVDRANALLDEAKRVRDLRLLPRELDPDLNEVTPTRKIKREIVADRFADLIGEMYAVSERRATA